MKNMMNFYKDKKVLITGHTGFKGSWMCKALLQAGAKVIGYALNPPTNPSLFEVADIEKQITSVIGDVRDYDRLYETFVKYQPEIVIHMAAQPIVRESYKDPVGTYSTNVMGTVNVLDCIRRTDCVKSFVNVTTDKVYLNEERTEGYKEDEQLNGYDPYSNSKSCSELVTSSYVNSFLKEKGVPVSTCRAGNVIGGGDFAPDRIIPDCVRSATEGKEIIVRNPKSTRPYQHVLESVIAYLMVAMEQYYDKSKASCYNVGPDENCVYTTGDITDLFCKTWNDEIQSSKEISVENLNHKVNWINRSDNGPHEAGFLKLDCTKIKKTFGWNPVWDMNRTMQKIVEWCFAYYGKKDISACMDNQIVEYLNDAKNV